MPVRDLIIQSIFFLLFLFALKKKLSRGVITSSRGFQKQTLTRINSKQNNTRQDNATMKRTKKKKNTDLLNNRNRKELQP